MRHTWVAVVLLLVAPLAGCTDDDEGPTTIAWDASPRDAQANEGFTVSWLLAGPEGTAEHTGLHYGAESVDDPQSPSDYSESAGVQADVDVPGTYSADVTLDEAGTYYFRAHAMVGEGDLWTEEVEVTVTGGGLPTPGEYEVTAEDVPTTVEPGQTFTITIIVDGSPPFASDHVGAHFGAASTSSPSTDVYTSTCDHRTGTVPGEFSVECDAPMDEGTIYLRGHMRITVGTDVRNEWSDDEFVITVGEPEGLVPPEPVTHEVVLADGSFEFDPAEVTVAAGDVIVWNYTTALPLSIVTHTATNETIGLDSGDIAGGESFSWTVPADLAPGTYGYICIYHGDTPAGMVGTIVVEERQA